MSAPTPTPETDAYFPTPGSMEWDEFIESRGQLEPPLLSAVVMARRFERERDAARAEVEKLREALTQVHSTVGESTLLNMRALVQEICRKALEEKK